MPQLRDKRRGRPRPPVHASLEGFPAVLVHAKLDGLVDLDLARLDEGLQRPLGQALA